MRDGLLANSGPFAKLMFSAFIVLACFLITLIAGLFLAVPIFGMGFMELIDSLSNITHPDYANLLKYFQVMQSIGLFVIPPFILGWFFGGNSFNYLKLDETIGWGTIALTAVIMISAIPLINLMAHLNAQMSLPDFLGPVEEWMKETEQAAERLTETFLAADNLTGLMVNILIIAVVPAIGEELLFRGVIQRLFSEWTRNHHAGIWISAIIFSAMHLQFFGFLPRTMLGVLFGYMLVWSGKMWIPIVAHFVNNAMAVTVYYFIQRKQVSEDVETIGADPGDWLFVILSLSFFVIFTVIFYHRQKHRYT
jgi:uncharacterized protein